MSEECWTFMVCHQRYSAIRWKGPSGRDYIITRQGTWVHNDDVDAAIRYTQLYTCPRTNETVSIRVFGIASPSVEALARKPPWEPSRINVMYDQSDDNLASLDEMESKRSRKRGTRRRRSRPKNE